MRLTIEQAEEQVPSVVAQLLEEGVAYEDLEDVLQLVVERQRDAWDTDPDGVFPLASEILHELREDGLLDGMTFKPIHEVRNA